MASVIFNWQQETWKRLLQMISQQRVPQALLVSGIKGLGKRVLIQQFAQALLCHSRLVDGDSCGQCVSCRLFQANTHPDWIVITPEPDKTIIGIEAIRQLSVQLTLKSQFDTYRVVLISLAEQLNQAAANGFLKTLEEPNQHTCIVLLTEKPNQLPATIRSRCQKILLTPPAFSTVESWLMAQRPEDNVKILFHLAQSAPLLALQYATDQLFSQRLECFSDWLKVARAELNPIIVAEKWIKYEMNIILFWLITWNSDMIKYSYCSTPPFIYHIDLAEELKLLVNQLDLIKLDRYYQKLLTKYQQLDTQVNKQLLCEELLIDWVNLNHIGA
jgi:DNA polymerase-3 subunit delta'